MTLLHQAAQKAVEAPAVHAAVREAGGIVHSDGNIFFTNAAKFMQAIAALQQQPEPVAKPSRVGEDGWRKLAESQAALLELANLAEDSAAELAAEIGANLPLERAIAGLDYFLTVKEDRRFIEGARADLMKLSEPPALQHQEVPCGNTPYDEGPFTIATDGGKEVPREPVAEAEKPFVWLPETYLTVGSGPDGWRFVFMHTDAIPPVNSIPLYRRAASPSTTRQQEVGSTPEGFRLLPVEATDAMMYADWDVTMSDAHSNGGVSAAAWRAMVEAAPQVTYGNGHSGVGWYMHDTDYPEEGAVFLGAAAPSTPENADGGPHG